MNLKVTIAIYIKYHIRFQARPLEHKTLSWLSVQFEHVRGIGNLYMFRIMSDTNTAFYRSSFYYILIQLTLQHGEWQNMIILNHFSSVFFPFLFVKITELHSEFSNLTFCVHVRCKCSVFKNEFHVHKVYRI